METFYIFQSKSNKRPVASDYGFNLLALFLGPIWGYLNQIWFISTLNILILVQLIYINQSLGILIIILSNIYWGFFGKDLLIQLLIKKKFFPQKIINAPSKKKALVIYLSEQQK
tara:strand:+ start:23 stop:364 length:342 start_codon:yes stop_codon:yes gene_type:complete